MQTATALDQMTDPDQLHAAIKMITQQYEQKIQSLNNANTELSNRNQKLENNNQKLKNTTIELQNKILIIEEELAKALRDKWGRSTEKLGASFYSKQAELFDEIENTPQSEEKPDEIITVPVKEHQRVRGKRQPLPEHLPRLEEVIELSEEEKTCGCGTKLVKIGEETSEKLEVIPQQFVVRKTIRPKYACPCCGGTENEPESAVLIAPVPETLLPKTNASPSLLATIATWKFEDALPLYRQEKIFARAGLELSRATTSRWMIEVAAKCQPLLKLLENHIRSGPHIGMDETTVQVLREEGRADTSTSYMWLARGGPPGKMAVRFMYRSSRSAALPEQFLSGWQGVLQTDGYKTYDTSLKNLGGIIHAGCWAHARRKFVEAEKLGKVTGSASTALTYIRKLYALEKQAREKQLGSQDITTLRQQEARPILADFKSWLDERSRQVPPDTLVGKAMAYTLGQWEKLVVYADYGLVPIDNNLVENAIRPFVIGRKNWLFSGGPNGADASATLYTLIETAKINGHLPFFYLNYLFTHLPLAKTSHDIEALLPYELSPTVVNNFSATAWAALG